MGGGGLTDKNLVVQGRVAVRKLAKGALEQVSTVMVSKGCVLVAYDSVNEKKEKKNEVLKISSSCTANILEQSRVIDSDRLTRTIRSISCFCITSCRNGLWGFEL